MGPSHEMFENGEQYEIIRSGVCVFKEHAIPKNRKDECLLFPSGTAIEVGDLLVGCVGKESHRVKRVSPVVAQSEVIYIKAYYKEREVTHSGVVQNIGNALNVAGRDNLGNANISVSIGDVLEYFMSEIEKSDATPEEKKTLMEKIKDISKHPIIAGASNIGIAQLLKWSIAGG